MKVEEKREARRMRQDGMSIIDIANQLGVSKASVSVWVRDIKLTDDQLKALSLKCTGKNSYEARMAGSRKMAEEARKKRAAWQEEGRKQARKRNPDHIAGCMLYWAEGHHMNNTNTVEFVNSDPGMVTMFLRFLLKFFDVCKNDVKFRIKHFDEYMSMDDAEKYWMGVTGLPSSSKRRGTLNARSIHSKGRRLNMITHGTCTLILCSTRILQHIFGATQEYSGSEHPEWLG